MGRAQRRVLIALVVLVLVPLVLLAVLDWRLSSALGRVDGAFESLGDRPPAATDGSVTVLLLATGQGGASSPALAWMPDEPTVVSALLVSVSGDRRSAYVDWLPLKGTMLTGLRDARPNASVAAAETWTGRRVDHLAVVEWAALARLGRDNGVLLDLPADPSRRTQQDFLRRVLENALHAEMRTQPWTLYRALYTVARGTAVEDGWSSTAMFRLMVELRDLRSAEIAFGSLDAPVGLTKFGE